MKEFLKKVPDKISLYTTIYMVAFTVFSLLNGTDSIPTVKLLQGLFIGACIGSWSEFSFGKCIISEMSLRKRTWLFVIPISLLLFATAVIFQWAASPNDYLKVFCILLLYWLFCILVLELSHRAKGRHYTLKLKAYQSESSHGASDAPQLVTAYDVTDNKNGADK